MVLQDKLLLLSFPTVRERSVSHRHVMSCHVVQSLPTDLVRSRQTLLYHVVLVKAPQTVPAAANMLFRYKSNRCAPLKPGLWFVVCLGCLLVRSGAGEDTRTSSTTSSSLWYQHLCR